MADNEPYSKGSEYLPDAFERETYALGKLIADKYDFYQTVVSFILHVVREPMSLVHFKPRIIHEAKRILATLENLPSQTISELSKVTEKNELSFGVRSAWPQTAISMTKPLLIASI